MAAFDPASEVICLEVQAPWARALVDGSKTVETRRYPLPEWARGVEVWILETVTGLANASALGDAPAAGAALLVGTCVFRDEVAYDGEARWRSDEARHLVAEGSPYDWDGSARYGWVVGSAAAAAPPAPCPPLERRFRSLYGSRAPERPLARLAGSFAERAVAAATPAFTVVAGGQSAILSLGAIKGLPETAVPSGRHAGKRGAKVSARAEAQPIQDTVQT